MRPCTRTHPCMQGMSLTPPSLSWKVGSRVEECCEQGDHSGKKGICWTSMMFLVLAECVVWRMCLNCACMYSQIKWGSPSLLTWLEWVETMKIGLLKQEAERMGVVHKNHLLNMCAWILTRWLLATWQLWLQQWCIIQHRRACKCENINSEVHAISFFRTN